MGRIPRKNGDLWSNSDVNKLKNLAKRNVDTDIIAKKLERTKGAVYNKAAEEDISLKPKDKP
jgi:hypothetical protein